jgi:hypothetical protein
VLLLLFWEAREKVQRSLYPSFSMVGTTHSKDPPEPGIVVHTINPSYSGERGRRI